MSTTFGLLEGVVVATDDPQQMGRVKVWCPAIDGDHYTIDVIPWATYVSPLAGQVEDFPAGPTGVATGGFTSYGFWAVPKMGASVLIGLLYGDKNKRCFIGSMFGDHGNRSLPVGRNRPDFAPAPVSDTFDPIEPQTNNLNIQFNGDLKSSQAQTRGAYERQVAQDQDLKDGTSGYQPAMQGKGLESQTFCWTTPGRHSLIMQDDPKTGRMRLKTAYGHQIIMDDVNERIYVSTAKGKSYFEMDVDGHIHAFADESYSVAAGGDINFTAGGSINLAAGTNLNLAAGGKAVISGCAGVHISGKVINLDSGSSMNLLSKGSMLMTGSTINLNGPMKAAVADCAGAPTIVPGHEPWKRPTGSTTRNPNWKE